MSSLDKQGALTEKQEKGRGRGKGRVALGRIGR